MKPSPHVPLRMLVAALVTGAFLAAASMIVSSLAVRATLGTVSGILPMALIVAGTMAGARSRRLVLPTPGHPADCRSCGNVQKPP